MEKVIFQPNMPVRMALKYADGKTVEGRFGDQEFYTLTDGRYMYVHPAVAAQINQLELRPGEPFEICKYWSGKKGESPQWDVRRVDLLPKDRIAAGAVATGIDETELERDLRRSLTERGVTPPPNGRAGASVAPPAPAVTAPWQGPLQHFPTASSKPNGNGSYTNGAATGVTPAPVPLKIPLNIAFREILAFCTKELARRPRAVVRFREAGPREHTTHSGGPRGLVHDLGTGERSCLAPPSSWPSPPGRGTSCPPVPAASTGAARRSGASAISTVCPIRPPAP
jgi:hypothetical protein